MNGMGVDQLLGHSAPCTAKKMCKSANIFLGSLTSDQIDKVKFPFSGDDLKKYGYETGQALGKKLKSLEEKWIENNFVIDKKDIKNFLVKVNEN